MIYSFNWNMLNSSADRLDRLHSEFIQLLFVLVESAGRD